MKDQIKKLKEQYHNTIDTLTTKEANLLAAEIKRLQTEYQESLMQGVNTNGFIRKVERNGEVFFDCDVFVLEKREGVWEIGGTNEAGEFKRVQAPTHEEVVKRWNNKEYDLLIK